MAVMCGYCGETWERDPALEVPCPQCLAPVGVKCRRPSGHDCELHHARDRAALEAGVVKRCTAAPVLLPPDHDHDPTPKQGALAI